MTEITTPRPVALRASLSDQVEAAIRRAAGAYIDEGAEATDEMDELCDRAVAAARETIAATRPGESLETSWPDAVPGAGQPGATPAGDVPAPTPTEGGDLAALSKKATQGEWLPDVQVYYDEDGGPAEDHTEGVMVLDHDDQPDSIIQCSKEDAEFIVALVNAYRSGRLVEAPSPTPARQEEGSRGERLSPEVQARIDAGRSRDGWEAWARNHSQVLRLALRLDGEAVAELEAFSVTGPWYANAKSPDGASHRLGAGGSLASAVRWCERITGYVVTGDAAPTPDANSGGEAPPSKVTAWLERQIEATHRDADNHPEGSGNRSFYRGQAIAYENALSLIEEGGR